MYQQFYDEIAEDSAVGAKAMECLAFERSIALLERTKAAGLNSVVAVEAFHFTSRLWNILLEDVSSPGNGLPPTLRAQIISIGIWVIKRIAALRDGQNSDIQGVIDVNKSILVGLKGGKC